MVRAKFVVTGISDPKQATRWLDGGGTEQVQAVDISLSAVVGGSEENKQFFTNTPTGQLSLSTVNMEAAKQFEKGKEYYVDFTPAQG